MVLGSDSDSVSCGKSALLSSCVSEYRPVISYCDSCRLDGNKGRNISVWLTALEIFFSTALSPFNLFTPATNEKWIMGLCKLFLKRESLFHVRTCSFGKCRKASNPFETQTSFRRRHEVGINHKSGMKSKTIEGLPGFGAFVLGYY